MDLKPLTKRQAEFLVKSAQGMTYQEIAQACHVATNTVRVTFTQARARLGAKTTTQCLILAISREEIGLNHDGYCFVPDRMTE